MCQICAVPDAEQFKIKYYTSLRKTIITLNMVKIANRNRQEENT